jgi:hypothetical protein
MFRKDEPLKSDHDARKFASIEAGFAATSTGADAAEEIFEDTLFEDILDIEAALRTAMSAVAGFTAPADDVAERGIAQLAGRIPDEDFTALQAQADALRAAIEAQDAGAVRTGQAAIVDSLVALRNTIV